MPIWGMSLLEIWFFSYQNPKDKETRSFPRNTSSDAIWEKPFLSLPTLQVYHEPLTARRACRPHVTAVISVHPFCKSQKQLAEDLKAQLLFPLLARKNIPSNIKSCTNDRCKMQSRPSSKQGRTKLCNFSIIVTKLVRKADIPPPGTTVIHNITYFMLLSCWPPLSSCPLDS